LGAEGRDAAVAALSAPGALPARHGRRGSRLRRDRAAPVPLVRAEPGTAPGVRRGRPRGERADAALRPAGRVQAALREAARARHWRPDILPAPTARGTPVSR